jgi:hypothetical protein
MFRRIHEAALPVAEACSFYGIRAMRYIEFLFSPNLSVNGVVSSPPLEPWYLRFCNLAFIILATFYNISNIYNSNLAESRTGLMLCPEGTSQLTCQRRPADTERARV